MMVGLMLTDTCNFQCKHCMVDSTLKHRVASDSVIERFYDIVRYNNPDTVCIVGGEPFLFLDKVSKIVHDLKEVCSNIVVYSNGSFLLDINRRERVKALGVGVRISKTIYHKSFWGSGLESLIDSSPYWKVEEMGESVAMFPRGRALKNNVYQDQSCRCSLVTGEYEGYYHSNRILVMCDGSVNIWCPCMSLELANVFTDEVITHDLLLQREKQLRGYLTSSNMVHDSMLFMCNEVCNRFKVSKDGIFRDGELMESFEE